MLERASLQSEGDGHADERLRRIDWDFIDSQSESPFSALHWHPCRFVSQIPASLIGILCPPDGVVLDPFCGSGTVLVEAQRLGRRSIGIDLNPISCLITKAKTVALPAHTLKTCVSSIVRRLAYSAKENRKHATPPDTVQIRKWYSPGVARQLSLIWDLIGNTEGLERLLMAATFSSILLSVCRETRHWGYVCDNTQPKGHRERDCFAAMIGGLEALCAAYEARDRYLAHSLESKAAVEPATGFCEDALQCLNALSAESISLVITSPPYFGVTDYVKSQRLSFEWFGYDIEEYRQREIGARSKRRRVTAPVDYRAEIAAALAAIHRVLKPGGLAVFVMGESSARQSVISDMDQLLQTTGFILRNEMVRMISIRRRQHPSLSEERIFVAARGKDDKAN